MSGEGGDPIKHPMDAIEQREAMRGLAANCRTFHEELVEQGFQPHEALQLTGKWIVGIMGGAANADRPLSFSDRYPTIVADPPWRVDGSQGDGRPWCSKGGRRNRETFFPYETQTLDWIKALPVSDLAEADAHLYLWVTAKFNRLGYGVDVAEAWGFEVVSEIVWAKPSFGLGKFPRPQHEILLVCRRGTLPYAINNAGSVQTWHQPRGKGNGGKIHSAKPDGSYDLIQQASPGPYLELFSRTARLGWDTWGDEALHGLAAMPA